MYYLKGTEPFHAFHRQPILASDLSNEREFTGVEMNNFDCNAHFAKYYDYLVYSTVLYTRGTFL